MNKEKTQFEIDYFENNGVWPIVVPEEDQYILTDDQIKLMEVACTSLKSFEFLQNTDWKLARHNDEVLSNTTPSLSTSELTELLALRQAARDTII